ncbi:Ger(x)C family spore germination protein [Brevibacillus fluminis]|uniref:Ger(X)C family spore germination protein n=1 Tax=Brevibacillus fluminis TaxID=511487 RepID=A0A3M8DSJ8_9BACL|nr:Ger(x)C family spore germination protein [Brevibacillus fluminis]RNB90421.1 Ger(x)C family spore germination protein [Brevibacillus fluminis]
MRRKRWGLALSLTVGLAFFLTGCWGQREIENIGLVIGLALDKGNGPGKIQLTQQIVNTITGHKQLETTDFYNLTTQGKTLFEAIRHTSNSTDRVPYYMHLKIVIISDQLATHYDFMELTSLLQRDHEIRRTVKVLFAQGSAKAILEKVSEKKEIPALNIWGVAKNDFKSSQMPRVVTLNDLEVNFTNSTSLLAQTITTVPSDVLIRGSAVVSGKKRKVVGWLNANETTGINLILGTDIGSRGGYITVPGQGKIKELVYEIRSVKTKIKPIVDGSNIMFAIGIETEGKIVEFRGDTDLFDQNAIHNADSKLEGEIKRLVMEALVKTKDVYKTDVAMFGQQLKITHYERWKKYRDNWDEQFSKCNTQVTVKAYIREFGARGSKLPKKK